METMMDFIHLTKAGPKVSERIKMLEEQVSGLSSSTEYLKKTAYSDDSAFEIRSLRREFHQYLTIVSLFEEHRFSPITRFIPIHVYGDEHPKSMERTVEVVEDFVRSFGFVVSDTFPTEKGSWYKKWFAKSSEALTQPEVLERLAKAERALEMMYLQKPQASVDREQAEAATALLNGLKDIPNAVMQIGSIVLVKTLQNGCPSVVARSLTQRELLYLEKHQEILKTPETFFSLLAQGVGKENQPQLKN